MAFLLGFVKAVGVGETLQIGGTKTLLLCFYVLGYYRVRGMGIWAEQSAPASISLFGLRLKVAEVVPSHQVVSERRSATMVKTSVEELKRGQEVAQVVVSSLVDRLEALTVQFKEMQEQSHSKWEEVQSQLATLGELSQERRGSSMISEQTMVWKGNTAHQIITDPKPWMNDRGNYFPKLEFPNFDGSNLEDWIYRSERYFERELVDEGMKVRLASVHMFGKAFQWHFTYIRNRGRAEIPWWSEYIKALRKRFDEMEHDVASAGVVGELSDTDETNGMANADSIEEVESVASDVTEKSKGNGHTAKNENGNGKNSYDQKKNRIQVSNTKKPLFFYVNLAKRYMQQHQEVELSALGMAIATVVTIAEILKNNGLATEKRILTSSVGMKDENKGRTIQKAKIEIVLEKSEKFDSLMATTARAIEDDAEEKIEVTN